MDSTTEAALLVADKVCMHLDMLTAQEQDALFSHFGLRGRDPLPMKLLAPALGCTRAEAAELIGSAVDKMRVQLLRE